LRIFLFLILGAGIGVGATLALTSSDDAKGGRTRLTAQREADIVRVDQAELIEQLRRRIAELEAELAGLKAPEENPYPDDTVEAIEQLLAAAYEDNNVDWLLQVIERLLLMGEEGYPALRKMIMDIIFKARFRPTESDFRMDQLYTAGKIFTKHEKPFMGFLNFLLSDAQTNKLLQQGAVPVAAFYVGSQAPGSEELSQTLLTMFLQQQGGGVPTNILMGNFGKRMNIFAMAMSGDPKMIDPLRDELNKTKDKRMQGEILGALAYLGDEKTLPLIKERLDPTSQDDSRNLVGALARLGTDEAHQTAVDFVRAMPDSKRFYRHAGKYVRAGGGSAGIALIKERVMANPDDPEVRSAIGTLQRFPSKESYETLMAISQGSSDAKTQKRATDAAKQVDDRLKGVLPDIAK
jgi:hypothetical protein